MGCIWKTEKQKMEWGVRGRDELEESDRSQPGPSLSHQAELSRERSRGRILVRRMAHGVGSWNLLEEGEGRPRGAEGSPSVRRRTEPWDASVTQQTGSGGCEEGRMCVWRIGGSVTVAVDQMRRANRRRLLRSWLAPRGTRGSLNQGRGDVPLVAPLLDNWHEFNPECNPKSHALIAWWEGPQVLPVTILARDLTPQTNRAVTPKVEGSQRCFRSWKSFWSS